MILVEHVVPHHTFLIKLLVFIPVENNPVSLQLLSCQVPIDSLHASAGLVCFKLQVVEDIIPDVQDLVSKVVEHLIMVVVSVFEDRLHLEQGLLLRGQEDLRQVLLDALIDVVDVDVYTQITVQLLGIELFQP